MTLKQAYENWAGDNENKILATKSLSATKKCFLEKYGNTPLKEVTRDFALNIFATCKEMKELRVKAAAVFAFVDELDGWKPAQAKVTNDGKERGGSRVSQEVLYVDASHPSEYVRYQSVYQAEKDLHVRNIAKKTDNMVIVSSHYFMTPDYYEKFMERYSQEHRTDIPLKTDEAPEEKNILLPESEQMQDLPEEVFSIETVTDGDLIDELRRRGWTGDVYVHVKL